jgi:3-hydroxybutyryl-CoA dehydrogenase
VNRLPIGVVGAGTMGAGIAQVCLSSGHEVTIHDIDQASVEQSRSSIERRSGPAAAARLRAVSSLGELAASSTVVIEAAVEDLAIKQSIFVELDRHARPDSILATNTSSLSVTEIGAVTAQRERVIGLHFFNPAPVMSLVEVAATEATDVGVIHRSLELVASLGKTAILCSDSPGFIVNRVNRPFTLEPLRIVEAGLAPVEAVDQALESAGYPMGPFRLIDLVGVDVNLAVAKALFDAFGGAPRFRPTGIQERLVAAGRLGRKTGAGFYRYGTDGRPVGVEPLEDVPPGERMRPDAVTERVQLALINEAYRAIGEGVADPADIERALKLGAGHPVGPLELAGSLGLRQVVSRLRELDRTWGAQSGDQFQVARTLWQMATV